MICAGFLYLGEIMEERSGGQEYLNLLRTELLKQREIYLVLKKGHGESVCYKPYQDEEWGTQDANYTARLRLAYYLLYGREGDEKSIVWLFEEELKDREQNSFQGIGSALEILTFLLKKYNEGNKYDDLFARAKNANFDCACGYDTELVISEDLAENNLLDCIYLCQELEYKPEMEVLVAQWKDSINEWDGRTREELIRFYTFLGKNEENESLYLAQLELAKSGKLRDLVLQYEKIIRYYIEMEKIGIAHQYLDEARGCVDEKTIKGTNLFQRIFEEAFEIVYLEKERGFDTEKTKELWEWAKQTSAWLSYRNFYTKAIAAAKAMEDPYVSQLERKYREWEKTWEIR